MCVSGCQELLWGLLIDNPKVIIAPLFFIGIKIVPPLKKVFPNDGSL
jgi:hypothetical protein